MKIEYFHASKFGNGAMVAEEFKQQMTARGVSVAVHHIREMRREDVAPAAKACTLVRQPSSNGPFSPVTKTLSSA